MDIFKTREQILEQAKRETAANQECDEFLARLEQRRQLQTADELVYKVHETGMDVQTSRAWNEWAKAIASQECGVLAEIIGHEVGKLMRKQADDLSARIDELEQRLTDLEMRLSDLEGGNKSAPVIPLRGGRGAA